MTLGVAAHLEKSEAARDPSELVASSVDLDALDDDALARVAGGEDRTRLVGTSHGEESSRVVRGVTC